ncbi:hypothetical protein GQ600_5084 [Phytophthora cactorum]|nr:hypothetical protein GQ600_5084 [Phytophthora cactorum]
MQQLVPFHRQKMTSPRVGAVYELGANATLKSRPMGSTRSDSERERLAHYYGKSAASIEHRALNLQWRLT